MEGKGGAVLLNGERYIIGPPAGLVSAPLLGIITAVLTHGTFPRSFLEDVGRISKQNYVPTSRESLGQTQSDSVTN